MKKQLIFFAMVLVIIAGLWFSCTTQKSSDETTTTSVSATSTTNAGTTTTTVIGSTGSTSTTIVGGTTTTTTIATLGNLTIGDNYGGGIVAYILVSGDPGYDAAVQHGLIAATADQSTGIHWAIAAYQSTAVTGTLTTLGSGLENTYKINAQNGVNKTYAAGVARAYDGGGNFDWYLPSLDELSKLYHNKAAIGGFAIDLYCSSSESDASSMCYESFGDGSQGSMYKKYLSCVRAVRTF